MVHERQHHKKTATYIQDRLPVNKSTRLLNASYPEHATSIWINHYTCLNNIKVSLVQLYLSFSAGSQCLLNLAHFNEHYKGQAVSCMQLDSHNSARHQLAC